MISLGSSSVAKNCSCGDADVGDRRVLHLSHLLWVPSPLKGITGDRNVPCNFRGVEREIFFSTFQVSCVAECIS